MAFVQIHHQNGLRAMREALNVLGDARRALKRAPSSSSPSPLPPSSSLLPSLSPPPSSLSPPAVGRAVIGAIKACSQTSSCAHLASAALERGLAETEQRHAQGSQFLYANLVDPILARVGGPVAAAVVKCYLPGGGGGGCADVDDSSAAAAAAAAAAQNKYLAAMMKLDESDLAEAPELVPGAVLGRLAKLVRSMNADLAPLLLLEQLYNEAYKAAKDASSEVVDAAEAFRKRGDAAAAAAEAVRVPAAAAAATAAAVRARIPEADILPDLLDVANDEFNRLFAGVDVELLGNMAESFEAVADASTAMVEKAYSALQASMDRHQAKELRDAMMLRSLRRIAEGGGEWGAPVPVLAAILDAYEAIVEAKHVKSATDLAAAGAGAAGADAAAASAAASALALPAAAPSCTVAGLGFKG